MGSGQQSLGKHHINARLMLHCCVGTTFCTYDTIVCNINKSIIKLGAMHIKGAGVLFVLDVCLI